LQARDTVFARDSLYPAWQDGKMRQTILAIATTGPGLYEFTNRVAAFVREAKVDTGLLTVFVRHTSCSLVIQENADPDVRRDLEEFFRRLVPRADDPSMRYLVHRLEGADDMPAHIRAALTAVSISVPVMDGRLALGTWQGIYLFEHRDRTGARWCCIWVPSQGLATG
jgi:secondary thiamine-phosphate synthase enzyme